MDKAIEVARSRTKTEMATSGGISAERWYVPSASQWPLIYQHIFRIHKLRRQSHHIKMQSHQDALRNNRNYLGTKKEVLRVLKRSKSEHPKKKALRKTHHNQMKSVGKNGHYKSWSMRQTESFQTLQIATLETYCRRLPNLLLLLEILLLQSMTKKQPCRVI